MVRKIKELETDNLIELINYSKKLMEEVKPNETTDIINQIFSSKMEIVRSIRELIKDKNSEGIEILLRSYIEYFFQLMFILDNPKLIENRALCYEYFFNKTMLEIKFDSDILLSAIENYNKKYNKKLEEFELRGLKLSIEKVLLDSKDDEKKLNCQKFKVVQEEIKKSPKSLKFYQHFLENEDSKINNLRELAEYLGLLNYYLLEYSLLSRNVHGSNNNKLNLETVYRIIFNVADDIFKSYEKNILNKQKNTTSKKLFEIKMRYKKK